MDLFSHETTLEMIKRAQNGDESATEELIINNIALVKSIVRGYLNRGTDYDDLVQIGSIGLLKAIKGYDSRYNVRFSTYAVPMISGEIKRFLRDDGMLKVSRSLKENANKIFRVQEHLKIKNGREPELSEISKESGFTCEEIIEALEAVRDPISLYEPITHDSDSKQSLLLDSMMDANQKDDVKILDNLLIEQLLNALTERERKIILLRFFRDKTQSEIAQIIGVSQVQVSRIISKVFDKLKSYVDE